MSKSNDIKTMNDCINGYFDEKLNEIGEEMNNKYCAMEVSFMLSQLRRDVTKVIIEVIDRSERSN